MSDFDERDLLTHELRERAAEVTGTHIGFDAVRGSARRIRRRRRVVSGAVAAVVLSVAVPTGIAVTGGLSAGPGPTEPPVADRPTPSPSPPAEPAPRPRPDGTFPLTLKGLPEGEDPEVSYVIAEDRALVTPDGRLDLPQAYTQVVRYRDGWMALGATDQGFENVELDADMEVVGTTPAGEGLALNADGTRLLWVQRDFKVPGRTVVLDSPATTDDEREQVTYDVQRGRSIQPLGSLDEQRVVFQAVDGEDGYVAMGVNDQDPHVVELEGFLRATAVSEASGLVAGTTSYDSETGESCSGVMDPVASPSRMVWETCDYILHEFSPDGRYVVVGPTYGDMWGPSELTVLDTQTWEPVVRLTPKKNVLGQVAQAVWEDADTVAAVVVENDVFGIVRAELNGRLELTTDVYRSSDMNLPVWFAEESR